MPDRPRPVTLLSHCYSLSYVALLSRKITLFDKLITITTPLMPLPLLLKGESTIADYMSEARSVFEVDYWSMLHILQLTDTAGSVGQLKNK